MKVRISEIFSLIFANWLLVSCTVFSYWCWKGVLCTKSDYGCQYFTGFKQFLSMIGCVLPLLLWLIFMIYAVVCDKELKNRRIGAFRFALLSLLCLLLVWIIIAFITSEAILIVATLLCLILVITDILYVRALLLEHRN